MLQGRGRVRMSHLIAVDRGCLGLGQVAVCLCTSVTFLMVQGWGPPPAVAKWGFLFSSSGLPPPPSFLYAQTPLTVPRRGGR